MSAVDKLARAPVETGDSEFVLEWAEAEQITTYAGACDVLAHPELATAAEYVMAFIVRNRLDVMFAGFRELLDLDDDGVSAP
jgi:hypothetical protein